MTNPLMYTVQNTARSVLFAATIVLLGVVLMTPPAALAQTSSNAETKTEPKAKAKGEPKGNAKGTEKTAAPAAPSAAAVSATTPPSLSPIQVGELSSVPAPAIAAKAWITLDVTSGQVVSSSNADQKIEPASLTKTGTKALAGSNRPGNGSMDCPMPGR